MELFRMLRNQGISGHVWTPFWPHMRDITPHSSEYSSFMAWITQPHLKPPSCIVWRNDYMMNAFFDHLNQLHFPSVWLVFTSSPSFDLFFFLVKTSPWLLPNLTLKSGSAVTGPKVISKALGKVLFIDKAYRLDEGCFAGEAIDELVDCVTKTKFANKATIILARYEVYMDRLMGVNQGLSSRFPRGGIPKPLSLVAVCNLFNTA